MRWRMVLGLLQESQILNFHPKMCVTVRRFSEKTEYWFNSSLSGEENGRKLGLLVLTNAIKQTLNSPVSSRVGLIRQYTYIRYTHIPWILIEGENVSHPMVSAQLKMSVAAAVPA